MRWIERYMGIPFVDDGMTITGLNCYGLVRLVLLEQAGVEIPPYHELTAEQMMAAAEEISSRSLAPPWHPVEIGQEKAFDIVVLRALLSSRDTGEGHVGVVTQPGWILHIERSIESTHVPFRDTNEVRGHITVKRRVVRIVRHEALL